MCMQDIQLGRELQSQARLVTVPAGASTPLCGVDVNRTRIVISADGVTKLTVGPSTIALATSAGIALTPQTPVIVLTVEEYGLLITQSWNGFCNATPVVATVIESTLERRK